MVKVEEHQDQFKSHGFGISGNNSMNKVFHFSLSNGVVLIKRNQAEYSVEERTMKCPFVNYTMPLEYPGYKAENYFS